MSCRDCPDYSLCHACDLSAVIDSHVDEEFAARFTAQCPCAADFRLPAGVCASDRCAHCSGTGKVLPAEKDLDTCRRCAAQGCDFGNVTTFRGLAGAA